jgi:hypothetical protein
MLRNAVLFAVMFGVTALYVGHSSAPDEPWLHRLRRVVPLSAIAGTVLALAAET